MYLNSVKKKDLFFPNVLLKKDIYIYEFHKQK